MTLTKNNNTQVRAGCRENMQGKLSKCQTASHSCSNILHLWIIMKECRPVVILQHKETFLKKFKSIIKWFLIENLTVPLNLNWWAGKGGKNPHDENHETTRLEMPIYISSLTQTCQKLLTNCEFFIPNISICQ
jgi:hypothetical protein